MTSDRPTTAPSRRAPAHGTIGEQRRAYAPVTVGTQDEAQQLASEMTTTSFHIVGLGIRIQPSVA